MNNWQPWIDDVIAKTTRWPDRLPMAQWCEDNIVIPRQTGTPFPGQFRMRPHAPWAEGLFDIIQDPDISQAAIMKGAQVSATLIAHCAVLYWMVNDPDPIMILMPTRDLARATSKLRIIPMMEETPSVAATFTGNPDDIANTEYLTRETYVRLFGANSPTNLASFSHRFGVLDEPDKYPPLVGKEGSAVGLISQRATMFDNSFLLALSTPTTQGGYIHRMFNDGDQRRFFIPCPFCDHMQWMKWKQVWFDEKKDTAIEASKTARYQCEDRQCEELWTDADKWTACQKGEWEATAKAKREGFASCHLGGIYTLVEKRSFKFLVQKFLSVKDEPADLQDFVNSDLGEIWEDKPKQSIAESKIYEIRDRHVYDRGTIPTNKRAFVILIADVQRAHIVWTVWALRPHDVYLVDHGYASVLEDIEQVVAGPYVDTAGVEYVCMREFYDTGYRTGEVYQWCLQNQRRRIAIKGNTGAQTTQAAPLRPSEIDRMPNGQKFPKGIGLRLWHIHPSYFKDELSRHLAPVDDDAPTTFKIHFHKEIDKDFVSQITGEVLMEDKKPDKFGRRKQFWKKIRVNDFFDNSQYMMAARFMARRDLAKLERIEKSGGELPAHVSESQAPVKKGQMKTKSVREKKKKDKEGVHYERTDDDEGWTD